MFISNSHSAKGAVMGWGGGAGRVLFSARHAEGAVSARGSLV